jgi:hypothetical protein
MAYVSALNDVLTDGVVVTVSVPKLGSTHSTVYGGVPPTNETDIDPTFVFKQSPVVDILY